MRVAAPRLVAWLREDAAGSTAEWCSLAQDAGGARLEGSLAGAAGGLPLRIDYRVCCAPGGETQSAEIDARHGSERIRIALSRNERGMWMRNGHAAPALAGCTDVDLGFSPSTNTLPIRRLALNVGQSATVDAAWVRFPGFDARLLNQSYARISDRAYRYASDGFAAELFVDADGLVIDYAEWRRVGVCGG